MKVAIVGPAHPYKGGAAQHTTALAHHLAEACFEEPKVMRARVRVEKPTALADVAAAAGVEITAVRG